MSSRQETSLLLRFEGLMLNMATKLSVLCVTGSKDILCCKSTLQMYSPETGWFYLVKSTWLTFKWLIFTVGGGHWLLVCLPGTAIMWNKLSNMLFHIAARSEQDYRIEMTEYALIFPQKIRRFLTEQQCIMKLYVIPQNPGWKYKKDVIISLDYPVPFWR